MLSEKKAVNALKPWWDVAFQVTITALIVLACLMLLVASGFGQEHYLAISKDGRSLTEANRLVKTTTHKNGQIDMVVQSSFSAIGGNDHEAINLTKTSIQLVNDSSSSMSFDGDKQSFRTKRSLPDINSSIASNSLNPKNQSPEQHDRDQTRDVISAIYTLVILSIIYLFEAGFNRVFYSDHLMQSLVHLITTLSDVREFNKTNHGLIFANTLHHAQNRGFLWTLFWMKNLVRVVLVIVALSVTAHFHLTDLSVSNGAANHTKVSIAVLMIMLIIGVLGLSVYSLMWPWIVATSPWGQLMQKYCTILNKIDVARGRCVPVPSNNMLHASRFSIMATTPMQMLSRNISKTSVERIVDALNPYTASPNIRLILDMVAHKSGLGVALRNLAFLEIDVHNNWRPFRPQISFVIDQVSDQSSLEVTWRDPLAILYLMPVPTELQLHYGIEIEHGIPGHDLIERVVEIIGYQESRYFRQIWHYQRHGSCASDLGGSTLTLNPENPQQSRDHNEPFVYRETFANIYPPNNNGNIKVSVWTIIDGQLIAKSSVTTITEPEQRPMTNATNAPTKPPRQVVKDETVKGPEEPVEVINEEGEEDLEATEDAGDDKYEEPKQITVQIEEQSRRPRQSCNKNLFESKSMTNLKPERLSMKRRHRFSGDKAFQNSINNLRKAKSVGNGSSLPFKSRDDFNVFQSTKAKIRYDSESGISNEGFEPESSNEHII